MLGFPLPYRGELLYSTIARHGIHSGIVSPKELLREVFCNTRIIATSDLPGHLRSIAALYPESLGITPIDLLYRHTLFPLYAPFIGDKRRKSLITQLVANGKSDVHLKVGMAASRLHQPVFLRYCPGCMKEQLQRYGECFWARKWQVSGVESCPVHGRLIDSDIHRHNVHRHLFCALDMELCPPVGQQPGCWQSDLVAQSVGELFELGIATVPELFQWGLWYRKLAIEFGFNRGNQICHESVGERVVNFWGRQWLSRYDLLPDNSESCWLRNLFRKHRKAFSYLEHLIVLHAFLEPGWKLEDIVRQVIRLKKPETNSSGQDMKTDRNNLYEHRSDWLIAVKKHGVKGARSNGFADVYAWLYRRDRRWLLQINLKNKMAEYKHPHKVNWPKRDRTTVRRLIALRDSTESQLDLPRHSMNWYLNRLEHKAGIEKHLDLLPLCRLFFNRYCENISEYQIRRITRTALRMMREDERLKRWQVLRLSGLSEDRLCELARRFLREILGI
ncbi:TnsD family Tn7-like transposition protein [Vibrio fluvialis]